jgi:hypothetical protein
MKHTTLSRVSDRYARIIPNEAIVESVAAWAVAAAERATRGVRAIDAQPPKVADEWLQSSRAIWEERPSGSGIT